jgi:hypothetical protein
MSIRLTAAGRLQVIERIMDARFLIAGADALRARDPTRWAAKGNSMGRGTRDEALRERDRLTEASDAQLCAELAELT